ncbi:MAG: flagellar motor stator protein MotA [Deltaproteobacteria bacterium]|nr:flagellar motor stator protein MotA [Deltaproteobacteria bacterium]
MFIIIGIGIVFASVVGGYLMEQGNLSVLWQPAEFVIILGAAAGALVISSPKVILKGIISSLTGIFSQKEITKEDFLELLTLLNQIFWKVRKDGLLSLEADVDNPTTSPVFMPYPNIIANKLLIDFLCDNIRVMITSSIPAHDLENLLDTDIEALSHNKIMSAQGVSKMADGLPGLGIVACVLGVVLTMQFINEPPDVLGKHIGAALVGTFLGVLACYGFVGPIGTNLEHKIKEKEILFNVVKSALISFQMGIAPQITIETARRAIPVEQRPFFTEVEEAIKRTKSKESKQS